MPTLASQTTMKGNKALLTLLCKTKHQPIIETDVDGYGVDVINSIVIIHYKKMETGVIPMRYILNSDTGLDIMYKLSLLPDDVLIYLFDDIAEFREVFAKARKVSFMTKIKGVFAWVLG